MPCIQKVISGIIDTVLQRNNKSLDTCKVVRALNVVSVLSGGGDRGERVKGIICAATVWPQWSGCGQLATTNLGEKAAASRWLKLASHRSPETESFGYSAAASRMHLFQCDDGELQQSFGLLL